VQVALVGQEQPVEVEFCGSFRFAFDRSRVAFGMMISAVCPFEYLSIDLINFARLES
jgi:hypothetical protein